MVVDGERWWDVFLSVYLHEDDECVFVCIYEDFLRVCIKNK